MARKRYSDEDVLRLLREIEVRLARGETAAQAARSIGVTEQSYYRWRKEYGGLQVGQAKRMKEIEKENARLRRAVSDLTLDTRVELGLKLVAIVSAYLLNAERKLFDDVVNEVDGFRLGVTVVDFQRSYTGCIINPGVPVAFDLSANFLFGFANRSRRVRLAGVRKLRESLRGSNYDVEFFQTSASSYLI